MKKYFVVTAKCGHVGKNAYYEGRFYEKAETAAEAARIVRGRGRVKHDHRDAILSVEEITSFLYLSGIEAKKDEAYFNCRNVQEQRAVRKEIEPYLRAETGNPEERRRSGESVRAVYDGKTRIRKPNRYARLYPVETSRYADTIGG